MIKGQKRGQTTGRMIRCLCGVSFYVSPALIKNGRKKYCSKQCMYVYRIRPKGLTYTITKENPTRLHVGSRPNASYVPPAGISFAPKTEFKKGNVPANFKGDAVGYMGLHSWVRRHLGRPEKCTHCGKSEGRLHWANISWQYKRDKTDWMSLCPSCHQFYDRSGHYTAARDKYGART